jgi:hypothetical protein
VRARRGEGWRGNVEQMLRTGDIEERICREEERRCIVEDRRWRGEEM